MLTGKPSQRGCFSQGAIDIASARFVEVQERFSEGSALQATLRCLMLRGESCRRVPVPFAAQKKAPARPVGGRYRGKEPGCTETFQSFVRLSIVEFGIGSFEVFADHRQAAVFLLQEIVDGTVVRRG